MQSRHVRRRKAGPEQGSSTLLGVLLAGLAVVVILLATMLGSLTPATPGREIDLARAEKLLAGRQVVAATIADRDARMVLRLHSGEIVWASYPSQGVLATSLMDELTRSVPAVRVDQQNDVHIRELVAEFILPLLLLVDIFGIIIVLTRGGAGQVKELFAFSRFRGRAQSPQASTTRFGDVAGLGTAVQELAEVRDYLRAPQRFARIGALPPKGVLLFGPPGCGKTLLARALAGEAGVPFFSLSGSEFVESLVGVGAARVRDLFVQARRAAPAIVFVDELDAAGRRRGTGVGGGHDEREQTLNEMLVQMDGFEPSLGVVVIAATNRPDILDPALLRPGRFDRQVLVEPPDVGGRLDILRLHAGDRRLAGGVDLASVARATPGFSGADLAGVINEAALLALRHDGDEIGQNDLDEAVLRVMAGPRRGRLLDDAEMTRLVWHEAGHAVVAAAVGLGDAVRRVSIVARGRHGGHTALLPRVERSIVTATDLRAELAVAMAGIAAEELELGETSTAAEGDLEHASQLARRYAALYGMSPTVGRLRLMQPDEEVFLGRDFRMQQTISARTLEVVDDAVRALIDDAEQRARLALEHHAGTLARVAAELRVRETLDEDTLRSLLADVEVAAAAALAG